MIVVSVVVSVVSSSWCIRGEDGVCYSHLVVVAFTVSSATVYQQRKLGWDPAYTLRE